MEVIDLVDPKASRLTSKQQLMIILRKKKMKLKLKKTLIDPISITLHEFKIKICESYIYMTQLIWLV
jgi:hypothetical protein